MNFRSGIRFAALALCLSASQAPAAEATAQDMQIVGRALSFKEGQRRGSLSLAIVYDASDSRSTSEMQAAVAALRGNLKVGDSYLRAVPVEQSQFSSARGYDGVFTASGVDQGRLRGALSASGVPCFTLDAQQVRSGACTVAVRSRPAVAISISSRNAAVAGVRFATAFIMMVREI